LACSARSPTNNHSTRPHKPHNPLSTFRGEPHCEVFGGYKWHPTTTRRYAVECARGEIWERIVTANVANAERAHEAYYAELTANRR
jgi:hypothetical protein